MVTVGPTNGTFISTQAIAIPNLGLASPYPSRLGVPCAPRAIQGLRVTLHGLSHTFPDDLDIVLVGPQGQSLVLMSDAGGGGANRLVGVDIIFGDNAPRPVPDSGLIVSGPYRPANYPGGDDDVFPAANITQLSGFDGTDANANGGVWSLYVYDDHSLDAGSLTGWSLEFLHNPVSVSLSALTILQDGAFRMQINGESNKTYYLQASTDLQLWTTIQTNQLIGTSGTATDSRVPQLNYRFYRVTSKINDCED
jgi:subtilisin-like proprotein convertase family protein